MDAETESVELVGEETTLNLARAVVFAAVTAATAAGVLASATGLEAQTGLLVRDALTALGLGLLVHSLYAGEFVASTN